ncbi:MAG: membrane protein insertase YidC, partial [Geminicoccaceae bacterium]
MPEQRNLILAIVLSVTIIIAFQYFYELPRIKESRQQETIRTEQAVEEGSEATPGGEAIAPSPPGASSAARPPEIARSEVIEGADRVEIDNGRIRGSFSLAGGRIDNLILSDYKLTTQPNSPDVALLTPPGSLQPYFVEFGWVSVDQSVPVPGRDAVWSTDATELRPGQPVTLTWDNGEGLRFERRIEIDDAYMFTISQRVVNDSEEPVSLYPYGLVSRWGTPETLGFFILHEGPIGVLNGTLEEIDYDDLQEDGIIEMPSQGGWLGFTDKYWLTALVPDQASELTATFRDNPVDGQDRYQVDYLRTPITVPAGGTIETTDRLFAGAKVVGELDRYSEQYGIPLFDRAVDFGWFY